jgi:hypothetical protein
LTIYRTRRARLSSSIPSQYAQRRFIFAELHRAIPPFQGSSSPILSHLPDSKIMLPVSSLVVRIQGTLEIINRTTHLLSASQPTRTSSMTTHLTSAMSPIATFASRLLCPASLPSSVSFNFSEFCFHGAAHITSLPLGKRYSCSRNDCKKGCGRISGFPST